MATEKQIEANRRNSTLSTGPSTEAGREASAQNHLTLGLFTRRDYVKPEERDLYKEFCDGFYSELGPEGHIETALAAEIVAASWRLRRCSEAEGDLADYAAQDPLLDESTEKTRRSIERARNSAHSHFHRSLNQLRKIQTERAVRIAINGKDESGLAECNKVDAARKKHQQPALAPEEPGLPEFLFHDINRLNDEMIASFRAAREAKQAELASNCQAPSEPPISPAECAAESENETAEAAADREFALKFLSLDEAGQLQLLADQRKIDEEERNAILTGSLYGEAA